jgi:predicted DNA-binding transcriptional regulator YafY
MARWSGDSPRPRRRRRVKFVFHPDQTIEAQPDGSLLVRFRASGWLEMAWHLYQWGDAVEVIAPEGLRALIEGHRRSDFEALP